MKNFPIFLSVVVVLRNQSAQARSLLAGISTSISSLVKDFELIVVDNASTDDSLVALKTLTGEGGLPNIQVYSLTKEVDADTAVWVGLENALGDYVSVLDAAADDAEFLPAMLERAVKGADVVFARNDQEPPQGLVYRFFFSVFNMLYRWFHGVHLAKESPQYRVLSRNVVNFILRYPMPAVAYRHLPATGGFSKVNLMYSAPPKASRTRRLGESIDRGMRLLLSTTRGPMRLVTTLSLFGALSNVLYSVYVIAIAIWKTDVAAGWVTLSLQQSGMFFLISLVLLVLGEYILHMARLSNEGPSYHIAQELTSATMTRKEKLNVEDEGEPSDASAAPWSASSGFAV